MKTLFFSCFIFWNVLAVGQDKKIDQLEILYDQGYYGKVFRKSAKLIALPEYDYSGLPSLYKSLSLFRLSEDEVWFKRHNYAIDEAVKEYRNFMNNERITDYISAHYHEISSLKTYLVDLETKFEKLRLNQEAETLQNFRLTELKGIKAQIDVRKQPEKRQKEVKPKDKDEEDLTENDPVKNDSPSLSFREKMVVYAKSLVGTKYAWSGTDPNGFDCSGFVGYVYRKYGIIIPRSASDQMNEAKKVNVKEAFWGDLVFFASGSRISHVGLVISEKGKDLVMIHSSTSKGVIVTEIDNSDYWKPKLKGAGTFI